MSKYEELLQIVEIISSDTENSGYQLLQYTESIGRFIASFSNLVNGTNDSSAKAVVASFSNAQKELYMATKSLLEAAKAGNDWCGADSPKLQLTKRL